MKKGFFFLKLSLKSDFTRFTQTKATEITIHFTFCFPHSDEDTWNRLSTPQLKNAKEITTPSSTTSKTTESSSSSPSIIDPYFTHFDPRAEHTNYKVNFEKN